MCTSDIAYQYFLAALRSFIKNKYEGRQNPLAIDTGYSDGFVSEVLKEKKRAGQLSQAKIALACGEDYLNFLLIGKRIIDGRMGKEVGASDLDLKDELIGVYRARVKDLEAEVERLKNERDPMAGSEEGL